MKKKTQVQFEYHIFVSSNLVLRWITSFLNANTSTVYLSTLCKTIRQQILNGILNAGMLKDTIDDSVQNEGHQHIQEVKLGSVERLLSYRMLVL